MRIIFIFLFSILFSNNIFCQNPKNEIEDVLNLQIKAWNRGSVEEFMDGYLKSDSIRFASGGNTIYGWQGMLDRYKNSYSTKEKMGKLKFSELDIQILNLNKALVFGKWEVARTKDTLGGLFTLVFEKNNNSWKIIYDHTSSK
ncbi:MAG: DUF4440 domain-containing protein [Bacteroidetes bacterium]|nr:DUF4440 domain-containing protein [Bacteroidota bacterium]